MPLPPPPLDWRTIPCPPLPPASGPIVLRLAPGELWCRACGAVALPGQHRDLDAATSRITQCCRRPDLVPAAQVLHPEEYRYA